MTVLFMINGAMGGVLTHDDGKPDEHVLVLGFDEDRDPLVVSEDGKVIIRAAYTELILDWRFVDGEWKTLEDIKLASGETGEEVPDAGGEEDGPAD